MVVQQRFILTMVSFTQTEGVFITFSKSNTKKFIKDLVVSENKKLGDVNFIFCSDDYLLEINKKHLNHDYYTDIITFDYCEGCRVSGDVFISVNRVLENSLIQKVDFFNEFYRVLFHGVLHLCGYKDKKQKDKNVMTSKEDFYLNKFNI